jgi:hypothetical protein
VWAIDADRAPLYWFPRDCPRVTTWADPGHLTAFQSAWHSRAPRRHAIESDWLARMASVTLYRYDLLADQFRPSQTPRVSGSPIR